MIKIVGYGEIGQSIGKLLHEKGLDFEWYDKGCTGTFYHHNPNSDSSIEVVHIALPYTENFITDVLDCGVVLDTAKYVFVHSTVKPGTCRKLYNLTDSRAIIHWPIVGKHPDLTDGIKNFTPWLGVPKVGEEYDITPYLNDLGIKRKHNLRSYETTEYLKLLSTTYYGLCIAFHKEVKELCSIRGLDFEDFRTWNNNYNYFYGYPYHRPVLKDVPGPIGGHCVVPNAKILKEDFFSSRVIDLILKHG